MLVENSSVEQIEAAVKLNESKRLVDLLNLDELTAPKPQSHNKKL